MPLIAPDPARLAATRATMKAEARVTKFDPHEAYEYESLEGLTSLLRDFCDFFGFPQLSADELLAEIPEDRPGLAAEAGWCRFWLFHFMTAWEAKASALAA